MSPDQIEGPIIRWRNYLICCKLDLFGEAFVFDSKNKLVGQYKTYVQAEGITRKLDQLDSYPHYVPLWMQEIIREEMLCNLI